MFSSTGGVNILLDFSAPASAENQNKPGIDIRKARTTNRRKSVALAINASREAIKAAQTVSKLADAGLILTIQQAASAPAATHASKIQEKR